MPDINNKSEVLIQFKYLTSKLLKHITELKLPRAGTKNLFLSSCCRLCLRATQLSLLSNGSRLCVSDLIDPNRSLAFTNPRLDTMVYLDAASTLVPLLVWAGVCTDVSTARHLCSEGIPHPHTGIPLRHAGLGRDPPSPTWDPFSVLPLFGRRPAVFCFLFYVLARCARQSEPRLKTEWERERDGGTKRGTGREPEEETERVESGRE